MNPYEPFTGVLLLPDRTPFGTTSEVTVGDGRPVAAIRWQRFSFGARFEVLDPSGGTVLATGSRASVWGLRYQVLGPRQETLLEMKLSGWGGVNGRTRITAAGGRLLTAKGNWSARRFEVADEHGRPVARLVTTSRFFSLRPDSLAFEPTVPVLSVVQAVGLAQCMRAAVESQRGSQAAASSS
jgi:hypothetical protein